MKVLVTGREGQLVRSLMERGAGRPHLTLIAAGRPELDLEKPGHLAETIHAISPAVIVNAAAYTAVDQAEEEPGRAQVVNGDAPTALAAAAREIGARIIQISTDYVFDGEKETAYREEDATNPLGVYGRTKLAGEAGVRRENPEHLIVRTAWVYSPFGRNFLKTMMALAESREELSVVDDQHGNPTSALDLADGLLAILDRWRRDEPAGLGKTYHLAGSGEASWREFAELIFFNCAQLGLPSAKVRPIRTADWPTKARRPLCSTLDCSKFATDLGFQMPQWRASATKTVERIAAAGQAAR